MNTSQYDLVCVVIFLITQCGDTVEYDLICVIDYSPNYTVYEYKSV